ncbi:MAG: glycosyltransferase family 4 protein [Gammaproteobacteria bacterium]|nr:glycosyltransferase family 4 protein [Gammaproteobacteria bacterium]
MKIGIFQVTSSYATGGCETYTWNLAHFLRQRGHECDLIAGLTERPIHPYPEVNLRMAAFMPRERVIDIGSRFRKLVERLTFAWNARTILLGGGYDILNIHKPYDIPAALWLRRRTGCRIVWRCHGTDFYPGLGKLIHRVDAIYCVSGFARDTLLETYPVEAEVIYTGVDSKFFDPERAPAAPGKTPRILYYGRLEGWKGVRYFVDALARIVARPWTARIIGDGPERDRLAARIAELELGARISMIPALRKREDVRQALADSDIVVFPPVGVETFSNAVLEAMSMEKAVVATRVGGLPEAVEDGVSGLLVAPRHDAMLAAAIERLVLDAGLRQRLAGEARRVVIDRFDAETSFSRAEALFGRTLEQGRNTHADSIRPRHINRR